MTTKQTKIRGHVFKKPRVRPPAAKRAGATLKKTASRLPTINRGQLYTWFAVGVLAATSTFWALMGAKVHQSNADQMVDTYLFEHASTFHTAFFPGEHSFLVKWPLFLAIRLFGSTDTAFMAGTLVLVLATVGGLAFILHRIDRRPAIFGTLLLALASVLLLVPPTPGAGVLLPVNMAMVTTRNIEYIIYIGCLVAIARATRFKSWWFLAGASGLTLLVASDRLFATLSLGGAVLALGAYAIARNKALVRLGGRWLITGIIAVLAATGLFWVINTSGLTQISFDTSPYGLVHNIKDAGRGAFFAVLGLITNFGANPAFDATMPQQLPSLLLHRLAVPTGITFVMNGALMALGAVMCLRLLIRSLRRSPKKQKQPEQKDTPTQVSLMLLWSVIAVTGAFIITNHYYVVDARYLAIVLFAVSVGAATYLRGRPLPSLKMQQFRNILILNHIKRLVYAKPADAVHPLFFFKIIRIAKGADEIKMSAAAILIAGIALLSLFVAMQIFTADDTALVDIGQHNELVAQSLRSHPADVLVGDYWRVLPIKNNTGGAQTITPLGTCTAPRQVLSSGSWQPDLNKHSFAYLLSLTKGLTDFPACTLDEVVALYGKPNSSVLIAGSHDKPRELLLYYDHGINKNAQTAAVPSPPSTVFPITPGLLPQPHCPSGLPSVMNIVAHEDDDLLFINPDLLHDLQAGHCVRTVYLTAGDAGADRLYWLAREKGSEAAYNTMLDSDTIWIERIVRLGDDHFVTIANPRGNQKISLIFMRLADGNLNGSGFAASHHESLARLEAGRVTLLHSVDKQSAYSNTQLVASLTTLMQTYLPDEVRTQATYNASNVWPDHSDHMAAGRYAQHAYQQYAQPATSIKYYIGYPIRQMPANIGQADLQVKTNAFLSYGHFDGAVCQSAEQCRRTATYNAYLTRQYSTTP